MEWIKVTDRLPTPGVPVLAYFRNSYNKDRIIRAEWSDGNSLEASWESDADWAIYDEENDRYLCPEGWFESNEYEDTHWNITDRVTHWMPLPGPPIKLKGRGEDDGRAV